MACGCANPQICHYGNNPQWVISPQAGYGGWHSLWNTSDKENAPLNQHYPHPQSNQTQFTSMTSYPYAHHGVQPIYDALYLQSHPYPSMALSYNSVPFPAAPIAPLGNNINATSSSTSTSNAPKWKCTNALSGNAAPRKKLKPWQSVMGASDVTPQADIVTA